MFKKLTNAPVLDLSNIIFGEDSQNNVGGGGHVGVNVGANVGPNANQVNLTKNMNHKPPLPNNHNMTTNPNSPIPPNRSKITSPIL